MKRFIKIKVVSWKNLSGGVGVAHGAPEDYIAEPDEVSDISEITFQIVEQTHRCEEFSPIGKGLPSDFFSSSGFELTSYTLPMMGSSLKRTLFMRGDCTADDYEKVTVSYDTFEEIVKAINEYNALYNQEEENEEKSMKKIELEIVADDLEQVCFKVSKQTHVGDDFGNDSNSVITPSGLVLKSVNAPAYERNGSLYVRGIYSKYNDRLVLVPRSVFDKIKKACDEYNEMFTKKREHKHITLEKLAENDGHVAFKILEQTHRQTAFGEDFSYEFFASNGIRLASVEFPHVYNSDNAFYVQGGDKSEDSMMMLTSSLFYKKLEKAVEEYNNYWK